jgi:hypothetical protein
MRDYAAVMFGSPLDYVYAGYGSWTGSEFAYDFACGVDFKQAAPGVVRD